MAQPRFVAMGKFHDASCQIIGPDGGARFIFDNGYGQLAPMAVGHPVCVSRAAIVRGADGEAGTQDE